MGHDSHVDMIAEKSGGVASKLASIDGKIGTRWQVRVHCTR